MDSNEALQFGNICNDADEYDKVNGNCNLGEWIRGLGSIKSCFNWYYLYNGLTLISSREKAAIRIIADYIHLEVYFCSN